jgi:hypothetical protein
VRAAVQPGARKQCRLLTQNGKDLLFQHRHMTSLPPSASSIARVSMKSTTFGLSFLMLKFICFDSRNLQTRKPTTTPTKSSQ